MKMGEEKREWKNLIKNNIISLILVIALICLGVVIAGNVIVKEGAMDVSQDLNVTGNITTKTLNSNSIILSGVSSNPFILKNSEGTAVFQIDNNGHVGQNVAPSPVAYYNMEPNHTTTSNTYDLRVLGYNTPSSDTSSFHYAFLLDKRNSGNANFTRAVGGGSMIALSAINRLYTTGITSRSTGIYTAHYVDKGVNTEHYAILVYPPILSNNATIVTYRGLYIGDVSAKANTSIAIQTDGGNIIFNEAGSNNSNVRMEGDTDANLFFINASSDRVGIGTPNPSAKLEVYGDSNGISIYASKNISATNYLYHTSIYDKSRGDALKFIQDSDYYKTNDLIGHTKFYGYVGEVTVTDYSRPVYVNDCRNEQDPNDENKILVICEQRITYPYTKQEKQVSLNSEIDVLRQAVYELKTELCKYNKYSWC